MDKHRKAVIELCAAIEIAQMRAHNGQKVMVEPEDWRAITKLVGEIKAGFNHAMGYQFEQHLDREKAYRGLVDGQEAKA